MTSPAETKKQFRDWLRAQLQARGFYTPATDSYALSAFARFCSEQGEAIDEQAVYRYTRDDNTLPSPDRCRSLARALGIKPVEVLKVAGYIQESDF